MPLRVRPATASTLAELCRDLRAADDKHPARELRSDGRTLYIKLRSAGCLFSRDSVRDTHRRHAVALVAQCLDRDLAPLGASHLAEGLLGQFLPGTRAGQPAPVRIAHVLDLERVVDRARRLAAHLPSFVAVRTAAACVLEARGVGIDLPSAPGPQAPAPASSATAEPRRPPFSWRAEDLLAQSRRMAQAPQALARSPDGRPILSAGYLHLAASFPVDELLTSQERERHERFLSQAGPELAKAGPAWRTLEVAQVKAFVERLVHLHRVTYGYDAVEVLFSRHQREAPALSADGARVVLPTRQPLEDDRFDEFVHYLVHGLTLRYQHHLADRLAAASGSERALASLLRAHQLVPMNRDTLVRRYGLGWRAAREAWLSSPSHRHATALADRVAAWAYASLPDGESRLPPMAGPGKRG